MPQYWKYLPDLVISRQRRRQMAGSTYRRSLSFVTMQEDWKEYTFVDYVKTVCMKMLAGPVGETDGMFYLKGKFDGRVRSAIVLRQLEITGADEHVFTISRKEQKQLWAQIEALHKR